MDNWRWAQLLAGRRVRNDYEYVRERCPPGIRCLYRTVKRPVIRRQLQCPPGPSCNSVLRRLSRAARTDPCDREGLRRQALRVADCYGTTYRVTSTYT